MKTNRIRMKIIFACMFFMFSIAGANAQHKNHDPEARAKKKTEWMKTELSLSAEQATKVEGINLKYGQKRKALKDEMRKQMKSLRQEEQKELEGVLTKEQLATYEKKKAERKEKRKQEYMNREKDYIKKDKK
jgi:hypothetical protein